MSEDVVSTYEMVTLQIKALNSLLNSTLAEPDIDYGFRQEMEKIKFILEDYLERNEQSEWQEKELSA